MHKLLNAGHEVSYTYITDGRHGSNIMSPEETLKVRAEEARKERELLGINKYWDFGVEDGTLAKLDASARSAVKQKILATLTECAPDIVLIPSRAEMHPDHRATHDLVWEVISESNLNTLVGKYIVWFFPDFYEKRPDVSDKIILVNIENEFDRKVQAIRLHESQVKEGAYDEIVNYVNRYFALIFRAYRSGGPKLVEKLALFNRKNANAETEQKFLAALGDTIDVTKTLHGRRDQDIVAQL